MDQVVIGEGSSTATFRSRTVSENDDTYAGESFVVEFNAEGVQVERVVFMFRFDWDNLVAFWSDLADSWRGWAGEKAWRSVEHDLAITATADALGHCVLTFTVRDGPMPTWTLTLTITMDGGEDMKSAADLFRAWTER